jgi:DNA modification methylase
VILNADARAIPLADRSVHCVVTSPPYWGLRDYGTATWEGGDPACAHRQGRPGSGRADGVVDERFQRNRDGTGAMGGDCATCGARRIDAQLGLEPTPEAYVAALVGVLREVWRVLRDDGTLWLNLGDSYNAYNGGAGPSSALSKIQSRERPQLESGYGLRMRTLKPKDLVGVPWRVAFALQADGWYLRSDIIWSKPNPMPESVTDRPTKSHEYLFLLAKRERYYYDAEAIKERSEGVNGGGFSRAYAEAQPNHGAMVLGRPIDNGSRNRRSVWEIATQPFPDAHFATFPEALVEPCILAGTSERGCCAKCGAGWERTVERTVERTDVDPLGEKARARSNGTAPYRPNSRESGGVAGVVTSTRQYWHPACACGAATTTPPLVLDPFAGSGTVGEVCHRLGRRFVGLELKPDYCRMAYRRTAQLGLV